MKVVFKPGNRGMEKIIGKLERAVLEVLWRRGNLPGREIYTQVCRRKKLAYTTILTVLNRLVKKGIVIRNKVDGIYFFAPATKKDEFERRVASLVIKGIFEISPACAVSTFVDILSGWDEQEVEKIMKLLEERKRVDH